MEYRKFTVTSDHIKLSKRMYTGWNDCCFGAPSVDCKRPYGDSMVFESIAKILKIVPEGEDHYDPFTEKQQDFMLKIHAEMETVLQIGLCTGRFEEGEYQMQDEYKSLSWKKIS